MEIEIAQQELLLGLQRIQGIISSKNIDRIFSFCLIETLENNTIKINATNKHQTIIGEYASEVKAPGKVCVEAKMLHDIVKVLDDGIVNLKLEAEKFSIRCNKSSFHLPTTPTTSFTTLPSFAEDEVEELLSINTKLLVRYFNSVNFAVFQNASKPLDNLFFTFDPEGEKSVTLVASNGQIFSEVDFVPEEGNMKTSNPFEFLLPKTAIKELLVLLNSADEQNVLIKRTGNHLLFELDKVTLALIPTNSPYVNYKRAYPQGNDIDVSIDKQLFINSVRKVSQVLEQTSVMIRLNFSNGALNFEAVNTLGAGDAQDAIEIDYQGPNVTIALNNGFLVEILSHYASDAVNLKIKDSKTPIMFRDEERPEYLGILNTMMIIDDEAADEDIEDDDSSEEDPY